MGTIQLIVCCATFLLWIVTVDGSGCQQKCDCGFKWIGDDEIEEKTTLRYEVMGGLIGGFTPLLIAGLSYLIYKKCRSASMKKRVTTPLREDSWASGTNSPRGGHDRPPGSTPISLYGETEDSFISGNNSFPNINNNPPVPNGKAESMMTSRYTNVHRNFPSNEINQWFKNVNTMKY